MNCNMRTWLAAYVLDGLEPGEERTVSRHLAGCSDCQNEVVELAWIPALLHCVPEEDVRALDEPSTPAAAPRSERMLAAMRAERRHRTRVRAAAAMAAVAVAAGVGAGAAFGGAFGGGRAPSPPVIKAVDPHTHVDAAVTLTGRTWGTQLQLQLSWVAPGQQCSLIAHARGGVSDVAATWTASYRGTATVSGATAIPLGQLTELDVVTTNGKQLVRLPVPGPSNNNGGQ